MKLTDCTMVRMSEEQAESLLTLVNDQIEDLRHCIKKQGAEPTPDEWINVCLIRFVTHYRNIKRNLKDLHFIRPTMITARESEIREALKDIHTGIFFR